MCYFDSSNSLEIREQTSSWWIILEMKFGNIRRGK